jgi:deoxyribonuclease V
MKIRQLHRWDLGPREAMALQDRLGVMVKRRRDFGKIRTVAGADIAVDDERRVGIAAVIVFTYPHLEEVERKTARVKLSYPYIPGLLSFREAPVLLKAFGRLSTVPDVILFDAQGIAHPRGLGLASHMGLILDRPSIGCAKSRLVGWHDEPGQDVGDWAPLRMVRRSPLAKRGGRAASDKVIGAVLRTRKKVKPIYVSIGHRIDLESSIKVVLSCLDRTRIPKPTREADHLVGRLKRGA